MARKMEKNFNLFFLVKKIIKSKKTKNELKLNNFVLIATPTPKADLTKADCLLSSTHSKNQ